jgi:TonB family protein
VVIGIGIWLMTRNSTTGNNPIANNLAQSEKPQQPVVSAPATVAPGRTSDSVNLPVAKEKSNKLAQYSPPPPVKEFTPALRSAPQSNQQLTVGSSRTDTPASAHKPVTATPTSSQSVETMASANAAKEQDKHVATSSLNEVVVAEPNATFKSTSQNADVAKKAPSNLPTLLQSKVDGLDVKPANKNLNGIVMATNGTPLAGAVVKMAGTNFGVITDENGHFVLHDVPEKKGSLTVGYIGYNTKKVSVNGDDSVSIALSPTKNGLNGVSDDQGSMASKRSIDAHPKTGWKAFNSYLSKNAVSPDGQTGKVNISFIVDGQGNLNDFKVLNSLSTATDQKAIDLVNKGPAWLGNADGQPHEVKLTIEFK